MKFGGFVFLAAALAFVVRAHSPGSFELDQSQPPPAQSAATQAGDPDNQGSAQASPANDQSTVTLMSLPVRAALREARKAETAATNEAPPIIAAEALPKAIVVAAPSIDPAAGASRNQSGASLARNLQRELRRVGCYDGAIDGEWDRTTRSAMGGFLDRVNAALPTTAPDPIMLTMLRGHRTAVCGEVCPSGQAMNDAGRCMPHAIVAKEARKRGTAVAVAEASNTGAFTTTVTRNEVKVSSGAAPAEAPASVRRPPPLPGRMAMGGPMTAREAPEPQGWWERLMGGTEPDSPIANPVKRTVTEPRIVRTDRPAEQLPVRPVEGEQAANGSSDGTALQSAALATTTTVSDKPAQRPKTSRRKASKGKASRSRYASRSWRGRNVQAMFQHPLGRM